MTKKYPAFAPPPERTWEQWDLLPLIFRSMDICLPNSFIVCHRQFRPLILGQDFCICYHTSCDWSQPPFKMLKLRGKVIIQIEEPEAGKYSLCQKEPKDPSKALCGSPHLVHKAQRTGYHQT